MTRFIWTLALLLLAIPSAYSQTTTIWQIGKYDQSSMEFSKVVRGHVLYKIGKSDWTKDWPGEEKTGSTYEITFDLPATPHGIFSLKISTLTYSTGVPAIDVGVNGHVGLYYLHPKVSYYVGDQRSVFDAAYSAYVLNIDIPPNYLKRGQNSISLSAVEQQHALLQQNNPSSLHYDVIVLSNNPLHMYKANTINATVMPTVFYKKKSGCLFEIVEAFLRFGKATPTRDVALDVNGKRYIQRISAMKDFGEERVEFDVPEWTGTLPAHLTIGNHAKQSFPLSLTASRKWTLFVVPHTHLDVGFTDYQGKVAEAQARTLDQAMSLIEQNPSFRFTTDGSWNVEQFLTTRSQEKQKEFLRLVKEDKIGVPAQYANLLTGYASLETLYRSLYYSKRLSLRYDLPFTYANTTDIPTYTGAYPSILASAGIKYWVVGGNNARAPILSHEPWNEKSPFWWEGPDGKKVIFWYSRQYSQIMFLFGLPPHLAAGYENLPIFLQAYQTPSYKLDVALIYGAQPENTDLYPEIARFATTWNRDFAYPKLQYATFADFFQYINQHYGSKLPTYKGDMGPYWEDGVGSDAYYTAEDRQNQSNALSAEIVSTISHNVVPYMHPPKTELDDIWRNIELYAEHTWTAGNSIRQPDSEEAVKQLAVKDNRAIQARFEIEDIRNRSLDQLANQIHVPARTLVVFNALNWKRNALVETDLGEKEGLVDLTTHQPVPVEVLFNKEKFRHVRFLASDIPAVGYKCFGILPKASSSYSPADISKDPVIENRYYRITIDPRSGSVESIFDKQLQRELVNRHSAYKFGQYLYVTGGDGDTKMIHPFETLPPGKLTIHPAENGEYLGARKLPWGDSIELRSSDVNTPAIQLEILLFNNQKKIEFRYQVEKSYTTAKEGVYFSFPVAVSAPQFEYATQQGWTNPAKGMLKGANVEWFSIQKWMAVHDADLTVGIVPVDAPLANFGDINRGEWPGEFHPKSSTIFSYIMNNYWNTNFQAGQGGTFKFRYVLTSASHFEPAMLTRLGWNSMESIELDHVVKQDKEGNPEGPLPAEGTSFLDIKAPNIVLVTWKLAEDGDGMILRLKDTSGQATNVPIEVLHTQISSARLCNAVEEDLQKLKVDGNQIYVNFRPHEVLTIRILP